MKACFKTDGPRVKMYMNENAGWQETLNVQANEIPKLEKMLGEIITPFSIMNEDEIGSDIHFRQQLILQQQAMQQLNIDLEAQQKRLEYDNLQQAVYDIHSLCSQDILRERIKEVEKSYVELKCDFMKFLSTVL